MKKLLLVASMLCLAGCAENEAMGVSHVNAEEVAQHQEPSTLLETQITRQQQLGKVLEQIAQHFGTMPNNATYYNNGLGLVHAGLIDLNQDGQNEMYVLLKGSPYANAELAHRNQDSYIFEIWAGNEQADEAELLFHEAINLDSSATSDVSISFVQSTSGETYVKRNHFRTQDGTNYDESKYYAYQKGRFVRVLQSYQSYGKINKQRLGTKAVDLKTFQKTMKAYEGEETFVIKSSAGKKAFAFDTADISGQIGHVFSTLTKGFNTVLLDGEDASSKDFKKIQTRMKDYRFYETMDKRDVTTYPRVIIDLIWRGKVRQDGGNLDYFMGYTEAQIAKKMKQLHDIELDGAALGLPSPKKPSPIELLHYEKGVFYMPPADHYGDHVVRDVTAAKKIANQTYFVTFRDTFFNAMEYYDATEDSTFDLNKYKNKPLSEWPEKTKAFLKTGIPSYAVVKFVNGTMQLHYMGYRNLTEAELKSF